MAISSGRRCPGLRRTDKEYGTYVRIRQRQEVDRFSIDDKAPDVAFQRRRVDVAIARQPQEILDRWPVVGQQRSGADERGELVGSRVERRKQPIEALDAQVAQP